MTEFSILKKKSFGIRKTTLFFTLFVTIICLALTLANSLILSYCDNASSLYGRYDLCVLDAADSGSITSDCKDRASVYISGFFNVDDKVIRIGTADEKAVDLLSIELLSGSFPEKENEIAIEESIPILLEYDCTVGDFITVPLKLANGEEIQTEFLITGIIADYAYRTPSDSSKDSGGMPNIIVSEEFSQKYSGIKNDLFATGCLLAPDTSEYTDACINTAKFSEERSTFIVIVFLLSCLLCVIGLATLVSAYLSDKEKQRNNVYLMKCSGISNKGCMRIRLSGLSIAVPVSSAAGVCLGLSLSYAVELLLRELYFPYLNFNFSYIFSLLIPVSAAMLAAAAGLVFYSGIISRPPLFSKPSSDTAESGLKITKSFFRKNPILSRAIKNVSYNSASFLSLILSSFLLILSTIVLQLVFSNIIVFSNESLTSDYSISVAGGMYFSAFAIPVDEEFFTEAEVEELESCSEIRYLFAMSQNKMYLTDEKLKEKNIPDVADVRDNHQYSEQAAAYYEDELAQYGYSKDTLMLQTKLIGVNESLMNYICGAGNDLADNSLIIIYRNKENGFLFENGDALSFTAPRIINNETETVNIDTVVSKQLFWNDDSVFDELFGEKNICFIVSDKLLKEKADIGNNLVFAYLNDSEAYTETEHIIGQLRALHSDGQHWKLSSNREENDSLRKTVGLLITVSVMVLVLLCIYAFTSVHTVVSNDFSNHKRTWGYLRAVSLTKSQAYKSELFSFVAAILTGAVLALGMYVTVLLLADEYALSVIFYVWKPAYLLIPGIALFSIGTLEIKRLTDMYWKKSVNDLISWE